MKYFIIFFLGIQVLFAQSAEEVAKKSFKVMSGYHSSIADTTMILKSAQGVVNKRKLILKRLERKNGDKSFIEFLYPLDIKGTKLLSYEKIGTDDKQWLYLPELKRTKRISSRNKSGSFMASEFSYEDISTQNYLNYTYPSNIKSVTINGVEYFEIERVPKDKNSGYSRQIAYIEKKTYLARFGKYYDRKNRLLKEIKFLKYRNINGIYRIQKIEIKNMQTKKSSQLILNDDKINVGLKEKDFTKRALK